jgi:hypothetical protein
MKRLMIHSMFAAATLVAVAGSSSAQVLNAEIPFAFRAGAVLMQPGSYQVKTDRTGAIFKVYVQQRDTNASIVLINFVLEKPSKAWVKAGQPKLGFDCSTARCALTEMWTGAAASSYRFFGPRRGSEPLHLTEVGMTPAKAD